MAVQPPKIDPRSYDDIVVQTEALAQKLTQWRPRPDGKPDAGKALIRIFGRMAAIVSDRLNKVPEKSFLAFLDLIGTQIAPPQPARVPLTFSLAEGSPDDAFVPAGTQVAAPATGNEQEEVVFELEQELIVTRSQLQAVYVRQPLVDGYSDRTSAALGAVDQDYPAFIATQRVPHHLYLACDELFTSPGAKTATLTFKTTAGSNLHKLPITWAYWDAEATTWQTLVGIVSGLTVTLDTNLPRLKIAPGKAITPGGDAIALTTETEINLKGDGTGQNFTGKTVRVLLEKGTTGAANLVVVELSASESAPDIAKRVCLAVLKVSAANLGTVSYAPLEQSGTESQDWLVTLKQLPPLKPHAINDQVAGWLRACLDMPVVGDRAKLPTITSITAKIDIKSDDSTQKQNLPPDACILNTVPLDIERDFFPLGEQPRFNDTFYIASGSAFRADQTVTIAIKLRQPGVIGKDGIEIAWEYWNGAKWDAIGKVNPKPTPAPAVTAASPGTDFSDSSVAFTKPEGGTIKFNVPAGIVPKSINGAESQWIRVRIVSGNYGQSATSKKTSQTYAGTNIPIYEFTEASFNPPVIESMTLNYTVSKTANVSECWTENDFTYSRQTASFQPFMPTDDQNPALYLGFDRPFPNRPITLYAQVQPLRPGRVSDRTTRIKISDAASGQSQLRVEPIRGFQIGQGIRIAPGSGFQEDHKIIAIQPDRDGGEWDLITVKERLANTQLAGTRIERIPLPPRLVWEYCGSERPQLWKPLGAIDETSAFTERGVIRFIGPTDFVPCQEFGQRLYWLRLRWDGGEFLVQPRLRRILPNTTWASQSLTLTDEGLGSSTGNPDQRFFTSQYPVLPGQWLEVRETLSPLEREALAASDRHALTLVHNEVGELEESWVCWQEVPDFYGSNRDDRHYVLNHLTGEIRFGDGQRGRVPPIGRQNLRLTHYRTGGGKQGNTLAGTVTQLKTTVPYIDGVTNLEAASGAADQESLERVKERGPKQLRHRDRAVTAQDIEDLALEVSAEVARARAIVPNFADELEWLPMYHIPITQPTEIKIHSLNWTEQLNLQVAFYAPGQSMPQHQQVIAKDPTKNAPNNPNLTYTITAAMLSLTAPQPPTFPLAQPLIWRVTFLNPHSTDVSSGSGMIDYGKGTQAIGFSRLTSRPHSTVVDAGRVELIIVPRSIAKQPTPNLALLDQVETDLRARCSPTLSLRVTEPDWVEVTITATIVPVSFQGADATRERAIRTLTQFLHPLTGGAGGRGWEFGRRPQESDIYALLESLEGVDYVKPKSLDLQVALTDRTTPHFLIYSGNHTINFT